MARRTSRRSRMSRRLLVTATLAAATTLAPAAASAAPFAFQPIGIQRINLPHGVTSAGWPVFAHDGKHLLFYSTGANTPGGSTGPGASAELWIVGVNGKGAHCLSCGVTNDPTSQGEGEITPFPDGKRVFFGSFFQPGSSHYGVLECTPSVADCATAHILPVDFTAAEPPLIPAGGPASAPALNTGGAYAAKLSPDGMHVGFSDIRTDSIETMVIGTLTRTAGAYTVADPKVINPAGPTSVLDQDLGRWSDGGALYEFKTFTHGGADATYVESGGGALLNPNVWSVNLATGRRTRLTSHPDYDEDMAGSPDGSLLALWSNRTMHMTDWFAGLPQVRDFIDTPAALMSLSLSSSNKRCHGPIWILPSSGDRGGTLSGQPIVDYSVPHVFVTNNLTGWPQWSPNGMMLALNTTNNTAGSGYPAHAPFLLVAHFTARRPTRPLAAVSSEPGGWAVAPTAYHSTYGYTGTRVFTGPRGGTVTVVYGASNVLAGHWSETYAHYSEDGRSFVSGTATITESSAGVGTYSASLAMTGAHTGSTHVSFDSAGAVGGTSTLDGHTVRGPSAEQAAKGACPSIQPKEPALHVTAKRLGRGTYRVLVTSSIASMGPNEARTDVSPVNDAALRFGTRTLHTGTSGTAVVTVRRSGRLSVTAGDTLRATSVRLTR